MTRLLAAAIAAAVVAGACGGDDDDATGRYDVVLVVGAAVTDESADPTAFPGEGSTFEERWHLDCDGDTCTLGRPDGGAVLGTLDGLVLTRVPGDEPTWRGEADDVEPEPSPEEPSPCAGTPAETWTVEVEVTLSDDLLVGSVFRQPEALLAGDCFGLDLTLGLSGVRREGEAALGGT